MNKKTAQRIALILFLVALAYRPLMNILPLGPKPLREAVAFVRHQAKESETFVTLGFSKSEPFSASEWVDRIFKEYVRLSGHPQGVVLINRSFDHEPQKKSAYEEVPYQLVLIPDDSAHKISVSGYQQWVEFSPLFTKSVALPGNKPAAAAPAQNVLRSSQPPYELESGVIIYDVNTEKAGPDSLNLGLEKKLIFTKNGEQEIQEHKGMMDWNGIRTLHFRIVTRGDEQFTIRFYEEAHRRYRAKHARLLRFHNETLKASGAVSGEIKQIEGKDCQVWNLPSADVSYCVWKGIPLEIREKIEGHAVIHTAVGIQEHADDFDASVFDFNAAETFGSPDFDLSNGTPTKMIMEQLLSEIATDQPPVPAK